MTVDSMVYRIKHHVPALFRLMYLFARPVAIMRHGRCRKTAVAAALLEGSVGGRHSVMRPLGVRDLDDLYAFLAGMPADHLYYFHPHDFSVPALRRVLRSAAFCCYGLYVEGKLHAYGILKLLPSRRGYFGGLVSPEAAGRGIGKFLWRYLWWQAYLIRVIPAATVHRDNTASLASQRSIRIVQMHEELPGGYRRVTYPVMESDKHAPELNL